MSNVVGLGTLGVTTRLMILMRGVLQLLKRPTWPNAHGLLGSIGTLHRQLERDKVLRIGRVPELRVTPFAAQDLLFW